MNTPAQKTNSQQYRPTWDVTYRGLPLTNGAWKAHLILLRAYRARRAPEFDWTTDELSIHEANVAIHSAGIVECPTCQLGVRPGAAFHGCEYRLSPYGEIYASQRGC